MREFTHSVTVEADPHRVIDAFFDPDALAAWWQVRRSLCVPRPLGSYAIEWDSTEWTDELLGRLGGAFRGVVIDFKPGREFFVGDAYWLPPDGEPIGPMALEVRCSEAEGRTVLHVRQSGEEDNVRWTRYFELLASGFAGSLEALKQHVEEGGPPADEGAGPPA
jgi:uncharacterized protein YndB with AHSA1/START domain